MFSSHFVMTQCLSVSTGKLNFTPSQPVWLYQGDEEEMEKKMKKTEKEMKEENHTHTKKRKKKKKYVSIWIWKSCPLHRLRQEEEDMLS